MSRLKASTNKTLILYGSVSRFIKSVLIKTFIKPVVNIYSKINMQRNGKASIDTKVKINTRMKGTKPLKSTIQPIVLISTKAYTNKPMKANIDIVSVIGHVSDSAFIKGVRAIMSRKISANIQSRVEFTSDCLKVSYRTLDQLDNLTLDSLDNLTLGEIDIVMT